MPKPPPTFWRRDDPQLHPSAQLQDRVGQPGRSTKCWALGRGVERASGSLAASVIGDGVARLHGVGNQAIVDDLDGAERAPPWRTAASTAAASLVSLSQSKTGIAGMCDRRVAGA